jgi:hypothetical protein
MRVEGSVSELAHELIREIEAEHGVSRGVAETVVVEGYRPIGRHGGRELRGVVGKGAVRTCHERIGALGVGIVSASDCGERPQVRTGSSSDGWVTTGLAKASVGGTRRSPRDENEGRGQSRSCDHGDLLTISFADVQRA